ncbi:hypothetical protein [Catenovulum adriaticum]|uniref:Uncharacterized protein n=1 Tax=Catenovulum adriaticum TaxID=2984846 RepID=A0ABY7AMT0_9ALTE|nr:hypothetical protein [Catenovulum sp. TS8]WAJ70858.1 hypothetical protein OLW01_03340 [Catenovulum sp. TS8]
MQITRNEFGISTQLEKANVSSINHTTALFARSKNDLFTQTRCA